MIAFGGQAHHPVALLLEGIQGAIQIHHPRHGKVFQGTGRHLGHRAGEAGVAALGQHQTVGPKRLGTAHDRPQIVGIGQAIHRQQQRRLPEAAATVDQGRQVQGFSRRGLQHDPLVDSPTTDLPQPGPGDLLHQHAGGLGLAQ